MEHKSHESEGANNLVESVRLPKVAKDLFLGRYTDREKKREGKCRETEDSKNFSYVRSRQCWWLGNEPKCEGEGKEKRYNERAFWKRHRWKE